MVKLIVKNIISGDLNHDDGDKLFSVVSSHLDKGLVSLDFIGMDIVTPSFLNTSFIPLVKKYDYAYLKKNLEIKNANSLIIKFIKQSINLALKEKSVVA